MTKVSDEEALAIQFHEIYERLAPGFGYETRRETRTFDPSSPNGKLMIAVCRELLTLRAAEPVGRWVAVSWNGNRLEELSVLLKRRDAAIWKREERGAKVPSNEDPYVQLIIDCARRFATEADALAAAPGEKPGHD